MATTPKSIDTLNAATKGGQLLRTFAEKHGATNVNLVSHRSIRFDLPAGKANDGVNRVKLTAREDGTVDIQLTQVIEVDLIGGVPTENVASTLAAFLGLEA